MDMTRLVDCRVKSALCMAFLQYKDADVPA